MAAVTQVSHRHSQGRAYYDKKLAEGKTPKEAPRSLKRQVSDAVFTRLRAGSSDKPLPGLPATPTTAAGDPARGSPAGQGTVPGMAGHSSIAAVPPSARRRPHSAARKARGQAAWHKEAF